MRIMGVVAEEAARNSFAGDRLWDETGRVWRRKRTHWLTRQDVRRFVHRKKRAALYAVEGEAVEWVEPEELGAFWRDIDGHLEVPGQAGAEPNADGETFGAHLWRSYDDRLLGFQRFC